MLSIKEVNTMLTITKIKLVNAIAELVYKSIYQRLAIDESKYITIYKYTNGDFSVTIYDNKDDTILCHKDYSKSMDILTIVDKIWDKLSNI